MDLEFHPLAEQEFLEAAYHYEACVPGLGSKFIDEMESVMARLTRQVP
jgi:hypothetical protein